MEQVIPFIFLGMEDVLKSLGFAIPIIVLTIFVIIKSRVFLSRARLYDDEYIKSRFKNAIAFRRYLIFPIFVISIIIMFTWIIMALILEKKMPPTQYYEIMDKTNSFIMLTICMMAISAPGVFCRGCTTKEMLNGKDILDFIARQRSANPPNDKEIQSSAISGNLLATINFGDDI